jgi:hypothetical protein
MTGRNGGGSPDFEEQSRVAGEMLERSLMKAVSSVETELGRVVRTGEADLERLARKIAETLAQLAIDSAVGGLGSGAPSAGGDAAGSLNGIASAIARAARRGARFT